MLDWIRNPEVIGPDECPILHRWTLIGGRRHGDVERSTDVRTTTREAPIKLLLHHFLPNADDRDVHDHPRAFITLVLRGGYDDLAPCGRCHGKRIVPRDPYSLIPTEITRLGIFGSAIACGRCDGEGVVLREHMRAGMIRRRRANHRHRTRVLPSGCWTLVLMGPLRREWGFWVGGEWLPWRMYMAKFGHGMRCE